MPRAICTRCGMLFVGWSLNYLPKQRCSRCGAPLKILEGQPEIAHNKSGVTPKFDPLDLPSGSFISRKSIT